MSSPPDASATCDTLLPPARALPSSPGSHQPIRKAPPFPLAIPSSSLSPHSQTKASHSKSSSNTRYSIESSHSDLTSVHSDVTSLHCSEFPSPPSALPPIPASPQTAKSLYFSTTPTTPRSRSPHSGFLPLQDPPRGGGRSLLGSPRSLKSFFSSSRPAGQSQFAAQQDQSPGMPMVSEPHASKSTEDSRHGYEQPGDSMPVRDSQYAVYKDSNQGASPSRPVTPTTAGTRQGWPSSSGGSSPLQPPRPAYIRDDLSALPHSPARNGSSFATHQEHTNTFGSSNQSAPQSPVSPQPPRSPLPVPPTKRDSARDSDRYSHIARKAGVTDMGIDISEEQLLSTDFITEMLRQPATSSPRSARFLRLPDSPRSLVSSDDPHSLGVHLNGEMRLMPQLNSALDSPGFVPISVSEIPPYDAMLSPRTPNPGSALSAEGDRGGDRIYFEGPWSLPVSPLSPSSNSQSLAVPGQVLRGHGSPHPLVPSTPMSVGSFSDAASPRGSHGFAQTKAKQLSELRKSSNSQSVASRLPIGPLSAAATAATIGRSKDVSPQIGSPRVRQHHYPRHGLIKPVTPLQQVPSTSTLQQAPSPSGSLSSPMNSHDQKQESTEAEVIEPPAQPEFREPIAVKSNILSVLSHTSSTRTQCNSLTPSLMLESRPVSSEEAVQPVQRLSQPRVSSHYSYDSNFLSSDSSRDVEDSNSDVEGEVQTASRVMGTSVPLMTRFDDVERPVVVGIATAVVVRSKSMDRRTSEQTGQNHQHLDASSPTSGFEPEMSRPSLLGNLSLTKFPPGSAAEQTIQNHQQLHPRSPTSGFEPEASAPPSPRHAPSIDSPPAHRTDIPESARSVYFSEDADHPKNPTYLPYDEVAGGGFTFRDVAQNAWSNVEPSVVPKHRSPNNAGSIKSVVSYITSKSRASTVASKVTKLSHRSQQSTASSHWAWWKKKPLPPLPPPSPLSLRNLGSVSDVQGGQQLPSQKERIGGSSPLLELGQYQRSKVDLVGQGEPQGWNDASTEKTPGVAGGESDTHGPAFFGSIGKSIGRVDFLGADSLKMVKRKVSRRQDTLNKNEASTHNPRDLSNVSNVPPSPRIVASFRRMITTKSRKWVFFSLIAIVILAIILGAVLGTTLSHSHSNGSSSCGGNQTGVRCNLDATCTCPSSLSGTCAAPLAKALNNLVPVASQLFVTNITSQGMALILWESQGTPVTPNCAFQAELVDVGSVLDGNLSPNRTQWAQAALLWTLFQTSDTDATRSLQTEIGKLPFGSLNSKDGIESDPSGTFSVSSSGYIYNFANQTVTTPSLTFNVDGSPSSQQLSRVNSVAGGALDRMYSFASASSAQQQAALSRYWTSVLTLHQNDLSVFLTAFKSAPVFLPFDATSSPGGQNISNLLSQAINRTLSFPPAIGCYPGLSSAQIQRISAVETQAFGLAALNSTPSIFDSSCFASHAVYGVLDVLRTRLPFSDSRSGAATQAAVLTSDATSRVVLHVGELLSALPAPNITDLTAFDVNPHKFGTVSHLNHIALQWLQSFPNISLATEAAKFVLSSPTAPPPSSSILFNATFLPTVEVAIFGNIFLPDFSSFLSSFSTPTGSLFFGSSQAQIFRRWALQQSSSSANITWSQSAFATQTVQEGPSTNTSFEQIWFAAGPLTTAPTNSSTVQEVVNTLGNAGLMSP